LELTGGRSWVDSSVNQIDTVLSQAQVTMQNDVEALMAAWQDAWFTKNGGAIAEMMTADYVYVAANGAVMDRATILGVIDDPTYALTGGGHTETVVSMLGEDAAMVRRRWQGSGTYRGQQFVEDHRCVTICDRSSGQWRIRYEQCSAIELPRS
jgi:ketosteroid isomerase-like protein